MARSNMQMHSEEMSLLGEKLGLMKSQNIIIKEIEKIELK